MPLPLDVQSDGFPAWLILHQAGSERRSLDLAWYTAGKVNGKIMPYLLCFILGSWHGWIHGIHHDDVPTLLVKAYSSATLDLRSVWASPHAIHKATPNIHRGSRPLLLCWPSRIIK